MPWSDDARVMARPFRAYAELASIAGEAGPAATRALVGRVGLILLILGGFVSLTAAGRLVAFHVASTMVFWAFVPAVQAAVFALALRLVGPRRDPPALAGALWLYFTGHGPWMLFLLLLAGVCLLSPDVYGTMTWLLRKGVLPAALLGTIVWSMVVTFACFRAGLGFTRGRAVAGTVVFYVGFTAAIVGWFLAGNQIQPQAPWVP
jgi:hypothetical protein